MKVYNQARGRLGNAVFRAMASILFCIVYDAELVPVFIHHDIADAIVVDENFFKDWSDQILTGHIATIDKNRNYVFTQYYQHDKIYLSMKEKIISFIDKHPDIILSTHFFENYKMIDLMSTRVKKPYDVAIHVRLEDFIDIDQCIDPRILRTLIGSLEKDSSCIVVKEPSTDTERRYLSFINPDMIPIESNDPITDFIIMKNAKTLVCSFSTISWSAFLLSDTIERVYVPDYPMRDHRSFRIPTQDTTLYPYRFVSRDDLRDILQIIS